MEILGIIGACFNALPVLRRLWHWLLERHMEIEVRPPYSQPQGKPIFVVYVGERPHIYMWVDLVLTNHRTDRKERIIGCTLHLKKRHRFLWDKTIAEVPVEYSRLQGVSVQRTPITNIELAPMSEPTVITADAQGPIGQPVISLPKRMKLVLEFRMVGPIRRIRRTVEYVTHDPKRHQSDSQSPQ